MTQTDHQAGTFTGDRYDRLHQAADVVANDPNMQNHDGLYNGAFVRVFATEIAEGKLLDNLSDRDANAATTYLLLDCTRGPERLAWRVTDVLNGNDPFDCEDPFAVTAAMARALAAMLAAFSEAHQ